MAYGAQRAQRFTPRTPPGAGTGRANGLSKNKPAYEM
jgi:hypothetical protein